MAPAKEMGNVFVTQDMQEPIAMNVESNIMNLFGMQQNCFVQIVMRLVAMEAATGQDRRVAASARRVGAWTQRMDVSM